MAALPWRSPSCLLGALIALALAAPAVAEQGVTEGEIVIGCSTSLSGPLGFTGEQATKYGVDLYVRALNDGGGIHGRKVRTVYHDDGLKAQEASANTRRLVEQDGVFTVVAPLGTAPVTATLEYLERNKVPMLFPLQGLPVTRGRKYVFSGTTLYDRQSRMMIDHLAGEGKHTRFGVLYGDDEYGKSFLTFFQKDLARHGLRLAAAESVKSGVLDVSAQIARLRAARPEVTLLALTPGPAAQALRERQKIEWKDTLMVSSGPLTDERYLALAGLAAEGVEGLSFWPDPVTSDLPALKRYREQMARYFPKNEPNRYSLAGYFAGMLFAEGVQRAGPGLTREGIVAALESVKAWDSGILPPITIGPDHETQKQGFWVKLDRGGFRQLTGWLRSE
jgi:branched-chain amino acid transport system substrate-binding protein